MMDKTLIVQVSQGVTNFLYRNNLQATEELMRYTYIYLYIRMFFNQGRGLYKSV